MENIPSKTKVVLPKVILVLLALEFLLGTLASLYQEVPEGVAKNNVYKPAGLIFFHVIVATTLFVLGLLFMVRTKMQNQSRKAIGASIGGFVCIVLALISGVLFIQTANDIFSFVMMFFGLGAILSYAQIVYAKNQ